MDEPIKGVEMPFPVVVFAAGFAAGLMSVLAVSKKELAITISAKPIIRALEKMAADSARVFTK